jgi:hypothetical protein
MDETKMKANADMDSDVTDRSGYPFCGPILLKSDPILFFLLIGRRKTLKMTSCRAETMESFYSRSVPSVGVPIL